MTLLEPPPNLLALLHEALPESGKKSIGLEDEDGSEEILSYAAFLAAGLAELHDFDATVWKEALEPYFPKNSAHPLTSGSSPEAIIESFRSAVENEYTEDDDAESYGDEDDDGAEEVCDLRFNLAYGGKILLHQTRLKLLRGHRYALVGQNGVGT